MMAPVAALLTMAFRVKMAVAPVRSVTMVAMLPLPPGAPQALTTAPTPVAPIVQVQLLNVTLAGWLSITGALAHRWAHDWSP